jgi:predicted PurR-regulated permease PerM
MGQERASLEPAQPFEFWTFQRVVWATLVLAGVVASFWLLYRFFQVVFILLIAILIGTTLDPVVDWLNRKGLPRWLGCLVVYLLLLILLISFLLLLLPLLIEQGVTISAAMPGYYQNFREWMIAQPNLLLNRLGGVLPTTLFNPVPAVPSGEAMLDTAGTAFAYASRVTQNLFKLGIVLLLAFYWTLDGARIIRSSLLLVSADRRESARTLIAAIEAKVSAYVAGQGLLCLVIGILALVAYLLIGLPYVLILALIAGIMEAVPIIGPVMGAVPAALIALSIAPDKLVWVILATVVIQQLENNLLVPRVMRQAVGVNPFVSLLSLFAFSSLLGIPGALMAVPAAAILQLLFDHFLFRARTVGVDLSSGRDFASQLRYEAQDLIQDLRKQARLQAVDDEPDSQQVNKAMDELEALTTDLDTQLAEAESTPAASTPEGPTAAGTPAAGAKPRKAGKP